ncbi:ABC transporter permease [Mucilaginibacter sp. OK098]|uniref:ABC transporter permease n=1 Tax=Mucilaginibacter sp. OK098 TaxID=1855297 RepID=UPI0009210B55|nr:ABC transporter permease [Mucilaginibacter sp. OK098]SHM07813.1 putative ABC transport system permease protein [Mucilaginibacter sp. OK098]
MIKNYFKTAWRNLVKNKFYSVINIAGLTLGLAIGMLILLWVQDELSFDSFHTKTKSIYRVNSFLGSGSTKRIWDNAQAPVATYALKEVPGVKNAVRISSGYNSVFSYKNKLLKENNTAYTDPSLFSMFDFKWIKGDAKNPFPNDQSVIITQSTAKKYFGEEDPIGKVLQQDHKDNYTVSGIIADFPDNSSINYDMLFSMNLVAKEYNGKGFWKSLDSNWGNFGYTTFFEIQPGTPIKPVGEKLIRIQAKNAPWIKVNLKENAYQLQPLSTIHLYQADGTASGMQTVNIFLIVAVLILLIACINYVNLSTARSMIRAKEVSIRKIVGAQKAQLFAQFIIETVLFFSIALVFAFILITLLMPYYNQISGKHMHLNLADPAVWKIVSLTVAGTLIAASIYPALLLSSFEPLKALKGKITLGVGNVTFRKILVTTQFIFSVTLIIVTLVIGKQLKYIREKDPGYDRSQVFSFQMGEMQKHQDLVKAELRNQPGIEAVTASDNTLVNNGNTTAGVDWDGKDANSGFIIHHLGIDEKFIPLMKIKLLAGNNFSGVKSDTAHFILNETAVKLTGIKNPIGKRLKLQETEGTIIGVVKDFNTASLKERIEPTVIYYEPKGYLLYVKTTGRNAAKAIAAATRLWNQYNPGFPFEYNFMDEEYGNLYKTEQRTGVLFNIFSAIAIIISCLGLLGLATYTAQIMTKEIGIRKVLGASVSSIVALVSKDFLKLILLSITIGSPIAWWAMNKWLQNFVYRIDINWVIFLLAGLISIGIALITISFQSIKAAVANPVKSLRSE